MQDILRAAPDETQQNWELLFIAAFWVQSTMQLALGRANPNATPSEQIDAVRNHLDTLEIDSLHGRELNNHFKDYIGPAPAIVTGPGAETSRRNRLVLEVWDLVLHNAKGVPRLARWRADIQAERKRLHENELAAVPPYLPAIVPADQPAITLGYECLFKTLPPRLFMEGAKRAFREGDLGQARALTRLGHWLFPKCDEIKVLEEALRVPTVRVVESTGRASRLASQRWLRQHAQVYMGKWVAICAGQLLAAADTLGEVRSQIGPIPEGTLLTRVL